MYGPAKMKMRANASWQERDGLNGDGESAVIWKQLPNKKGEEGEEEAEAEKRRRFGSNHKDASRW